MLPVRRNVRAALVNGAADNGPEAEAGDARGKRATVAGFSPVSSRRSTIGGSITGLHDHDSRLTLRLAHRISRLDLRVVLGDVLRGRAGSGARVLLVGTG